MNLVRGVLLAVLGLVGSAAALEPGVSHELALARAARISNLRYSLLFQLHQHSDTTLGHVNLSFDDSGHGDLALDYRDGTVVTASVNHHELALRAEQGHLVIPAAALLATGNTVEIAFRHQRRGGRQGHHPV